MADERWLSVEQVARACNMTPGLVRSIATEEGLRRDAWAFTVSEGKRIAGRAQAKGLIGAEWQDSHVWALQAVPASQLAAAPRKRSGCGVGCLVVIIAIVAISLGSVILSANGGSEGERDDAQEAPAGGYQLSVSPEPDGFAVRVSGDTNLPDGTRITLLVFRPFLNSAAETDPGQIRVANAGGESALVSGGSYEAIVPLDAGLLEFAASAEPIELLGDSLIVCAQVRNGVTDAGAGVQPDGEVRAALGEDGGALEGSPGVQVLGELTDTPTYLLEQSASVVVAAPVDAVAAAQGFPPSVGPLEGFCLV